MPTKPSAPFPFSCAFLAVSPRRLAIGLGALFAYFFCVDPGSFPRGGGPLPRTTTSPLVEFWAPGGARTGVSAKSRRHGSLRFYQNETSPAAAATSEAQSSVWDKPTLSLCERDQVVQGRWEPIHLDEPPYRPPEGSPVCDSRDKLHDESGWDTYAWVPSAADCELTEWNQDAFCEMARFSTVLIAGDSLSYEHYSSLCQLLGLPMDEGYQHMSRLGKANVGHAVCGGKTRLVFRRDDSLAGLREALDEIRPNLPQVLVLNRGAHYENDDKYASELRTTLNVVEEWLGECDRFGIKCHFFWRTTVPGHVHCRNFTAPVNGKAEIEAHIANLSLYSPVELEYRWYDFQRQNLLAEDELTKRRAALRYRIIDGYHINVLRPDGHYDCLHSCYPGKMDVYSQLLLHYLRIDRSQEDVHRLEQVFHEHEWTVNLSTAYYDWRNGPPTNGSAAT